MNKLSFAQNELLLCTNVLNEVCGGFHIADFEHVIGSRRDAEALLQRLTEAYCGINAWPADVAIAKPEAAILVNALRAFLHEHEHGGEFQSRLGVSRAFAFGFLGTLEGALAAG